MGDLSGKVKEALGYVTGDRREEAKGRVEQGIADPAETAREVEAEEREVRREHGEYKPERLPGRG